VAVVIFDGAAENPTTEHVAAGLVVAVEYDVDFIVGVGGGSAMDCAKGINLILMNGGGISSYRGDPPLDVLAKRQRLLPMNLIPTTAGTGSEAQSFALITDPESHQKMVCGDRRLPTEGGLRPRAALLDPELLRTVPRRVAAAAAIDALSHAIETAATKRRNEISREFSRAAWEKLDGAFERALMNEPTAHGDMLLGAHLAGCAIEFSMLGAAHACANPLTARFNITHGHAVGIMLPHVVRFNSALGTNFYSDICDDAESLARRVETLLGLAGLGARLGECGVPASAIPDLAQSAATQWTGGFNPRPVARAEFHDLYVAAL